MAIFSLKVIAKITPPVGWWDKAGIDKDITARGAPWAKGTKLGDMKRNPNTTMS